MSRPLVSVVIPAYNAARTISEAVDSVLTQTLSDFELIIINDGSTDDTGKIARAAAEKDSRIKVLDGPNLGAAGARNAGINASLGKLVAFLDSDDVWLPNKLEEQSRPFEAEQGVRSVRCGAFLVDDKLTVLSRRPCYDSGDVLQEILLFQNQSPWMSTLVVDRTAFSEIGMFDTSLAMIEDWEFAIRLARLGPMKSVEEPLAYYRQHPGNRSKDWRAHIESGLQILDRLFRDPTVPIEVQNQRAKIYSRFYLMICGAAFAASSPGDAIRWGLRAIFAHPSAIGYILALPLRRRKNRA